MFHRQEHVRELCGEAVDVVSTGKMEGDGADSLRGGG